MLSVLLLFVIVVAVVRGAAIPEERWDPYNACYDPLSSPDTDLAYAVTPAYALTNLGPYSPYVSLYSSISRCPPAGWVVDQVQWISRHGARNPTASALTSIRASLAKLQNATSSTDHKLAFVPGYVYPGVTSDALSNFGRREMYLAGQRAAKTYPDLIKDHFLRASSTQRVVESSQWFLAGLTGATFSNSSLNTSAPDVVLYEGTKLNDTLNQQYACAAYVNASSTLSDLAESTWLSVFAPPITARINAALKTNITNADTLNLLSLCGFDSIKALNWTNSPWCNAFTEQEFKQNEYWYDVSKFYANSWGNPYGRVNGAGLVAEILARLTSTPLIKTTRINSTLDTKNATFPLNKAFYADFSHDNNLVHLLPALGLSWESDLPVKANASSITPHNFVVSNLVPFAGNFIFERLISPDKKHYVRLLINDQVQRLTYAGCGEMGIEQGLCELSTFIGAQSFIRQMPSVWDQICTATPITKSLAYQP